MKAISPIVSSIIYRQVHPSETTAVSSLAREVFDQFVAPHYQTEGVAEFHHYASVEALSQRHKSGYITLVAEHSGELVGMLHLREPRHVSMLFVQSSLQRSGVARALLASAGDVNCEFTVNSSPNAVAAYERLGFRVTGSEQCVHGIRFIPMQRLSANDRNV
jgi:GNAT superfamily N-acetyltransferase